MKQKHMTKEMRERIEKGIREGDSLKEIAKAIDKDPTTVSKEVKLSKQLYDKSLSFIKWSGCYKCKNKIGCK